MYRLGVTLQVGAVSTCQKVPYDAALAYRVNAQSGSAGMATRHEAIHVDLRRAAGHHVCHSPRAAAAQCPAAGAVPQVEPQAGHAAVAYLR